LNSTVRNINADFRRVRDSIRRFIQNGSGGISKNPKNLVYERSEYVDDGLEKIAKDQEYIYS
jgi:hypothetical protein